MPQELTSWARARAAALALSAILVTSWKRYLEATGGVFGGCCEFGAEGVDADVEVMKCSLVKYSGAAGLQTKHSKILRLAHSQGPTPPAYPTFKYITSKLVRFRLFHKSNVV